ncbi:RagB/SusD family nutrient uptake outer membrane protein [Pedobacter sp. MC2016-24]|uniref:RagB/SusD family nutrient uptake outer membrane protein n=1 Tax=Pedobacter sp. MC2016-24 TaxID=2780090 RepID=UPI00187FEC3F|nr:RagB/SusD family nutrient uptake outer membrane protein [Pedobacter sp. MC2016-24]MBE9603085.1 RagB/SusD family nutrient uptake outer membrane protein [Pedobacter sp. MC2016-24]
MKTNYKSTGSILLAMLCMVLFSCKKSFLEVTPKGKLIAQKVADYDLLLNNLLIISASAQVPMGDEVAAIEPYFSGANMKTQRLFRWDEVIYEPDEDAAETLVPLQHIYLFNKIINEVPAATDGTAQQKLSIQAEALAGRAWTYFLLINYFAKPYDANTAGSDPGFPILTKADVTGTSFTRASVKEVYDFIVSDLLKAIPNLPAKTTYRVRMSKAGAEGLLGKVYLFMGKSNEALPLLNTAITDISSAAIPLGLYDYNVTFAAGGEFLPIGLFGPAYPYGPNIKESVFGKQSYNTWTFNTSEIVISKKTADLFDPSDLRLKFYSPAAYFGPAYPAGLLRKMGPSNLQFGVTVPDLYLLRAECRARMNDLAGAKADVETLRAKRIPPASYAVPSAVASQQLPLLKFIIEERIREFAVAGYRWFDMRRLSVDPLFSGITFTHTLYAASGSVVNTFTLKPQRFVLRFPQKVMDENPGMQNNP